ncbi:uncharacterized protein [Solanum lycopersicum]|uniref:uncharacterized protein n=1 Tax=Solanum lycopersicum TaxID=4081 RepID=UPI0037479658
MGSLASLSVEERPLARDVQLLAKSLVRVQISEESDGMISFIEARSSLVKQIRAYKFDDEKLCLIRDKVLRGEAKKSVLDSDGVLRIGGRICVPRTGDLIRMILEEAHYSRYSIHPRAAKMLTKSAHLIPVRVKYTAKKLAELYNSQIVRLHGVPISIISDRDGQSERTIQVLEDMLRSCVINFGARWDQYLPLAEFTYSNSYHSSIQMAPFEALYGRRYRSPIGWFDSMEMDSLDTDLLRDAMEKIRMIQYRLLTAQSRQKSYADRRYIPDEPHVLSLDSVELGPDFASEEEPIAILNRQIRKLRTKEIALLKCNGSTDQWKKQLGRLSLICVLDILNFLKLQIID